MIHKCLLLSAIIATLLLPYSTETKCASEAEEYAVHVIRTTFLQYQRIPIPRIASESLYNAQLEFEKFYKNSNLDVRSAASQMLMAIKNLIAKLQASIKEKDKNDAPDTKILLYIKSLVERDGARAGQPFGKVLGDYAEFLRKNQKLKAAIWEKYQTKELFEKNLSLLYYYGIYKQALMVLRDNIEPNKIQENPQTAALHNWLVAMLSSILGEFQNLPNVTDDVEGFIRNEELRCFHGRIGPTAGVVPPAADGQQNPKPKQHNEEQIGQNEFKITVLDRKDGPIKCRVKLYKPTPENWYPAENNHFQFSTETNENGIAKFQIEQGKLIIDELWALVINEGGQKLMRKMFFYTKRPIIIRFMEENLVEEDMTNDKIQPSPTTRTFKIAIVWKKSETHKFIKPPGAYGFWVRLYRPDPKNREKWIRDYLISKSAGMEHFEENFAEVTFDLSHHQFLLENGVELAVKISVRLTDNTHNHENAITKFFTYQRGMEQITFPYDHSEIKGKRKSDDFDSQPSDEQPLPQQSPAEQIGRNTFEIAVFDRNGSPLKCSVRLYKPLPDDWSEVANQSHVEGRTDTDENGIAKFNTAQVKPLFRELWAVEINVAHHQPMRKMFVYIERPLIIRFMEENLVEEDITKTQVGPAARNLFIKLFKVTVVWEDNEIHKFIKTADGFLIRVFKPDRDDREQPYLKSRDKTYIAKKWAGIETLAQNFAEVDFPQNVLTSIMQAYQNHQNSAHNYGPPMALKDGTEFGVKISVKNDDDYHARKKTITKYFIYRPGMEQITFPYHFNETKGAKNETKGAKNETKGAKRKHDGADASASKKTKHTDVEHTDNVEQEFFYFNF